jgi:hypothetical protein
MAKFGQLNGRYESNNFLCGFRAGWRIFHLSKQKNIWIEVQIRCYRNHFDAAADRRKLAPLSGRTIVGDT